VAHIDTEGGLAHFARAANVPAVVFFGTTSDVFFGYPGNLNLASPACGRCWYSNATWIAHCPRGTAGPECTASIDLNPLRRQLPALISMRDRPSPHVIARVLFGEPAADPCPTTTSLAEWGLAIAQRWAAQHLHNRRAPRLGVLTQAPGHPAAPDSVQLVSNDAVALGSIYNMPVNDGAYDVVLCVDVLAATSERAAALEDLLRLVGRDGLLVIATPLTVASSSNLSPMGLWDCLGDAVLFDPDAIAASAAVVQDTGGETRTGTAWACFCVSRPRVETAKCQRLQPQRLRWPDRR
jgi:Methyltransferase domain